MKILEVLPLEKQKMQTLTSLNQFSFYLFIQVQESWLPTFQQCHNGAKYSDKYKLKPSSQIISY
jgi:hypothetical protein